MVSPIAPSVRREVVSLREGAEGKRDRRQLWQVTSMRGWILCGGAYALC